MLHILFYLETALHVSGGTAIYHQERKQLYVFTTQHIQTSSNSSTIAAGGSNGVANTRYCR